MERQAIESFLALQQAQHADHEDDETTSRGLYVRAHHGLQGVLTSIQDTQQSQCLIGILKNVEERIHTIDTEMVRRAQRGGNNIDGQQTSQTDLTLLIHRSFHELPVPSPPSEPVAPNSTMRRPFWFLRRVHETMCNPSGGHLTNEISVPHQVWCQVDGGRVISNLQNKVAYFQGLSKVLHRLQSELKYEQLKQGKLSVPILDVFIKDCTILQQTCLYSKDASTATALHAHQDPTSQSILKIGKKPGGGGMVSNTNTTAAAGPGGSQVHSSPFLASYVPTLQNLLSDIQFLDSWILQLQHTGFKDVAADVLERLHKVSVVVFLGICCVTYKDVFSLIHLYLTVQEKTFL